MQNKTNTAILLILILVTGLALRVFGINWGLPSKNYYFSYHSDEVNYMRGLARMSPARLDFNPRFLTWGNWHFYELGAAIALARASNLVTLSKDKYFYYSHPREMAKIYLVGRYLSVFFAVATIFLVYLLGKKILDEKAGLLASFLIAINPAHVVNSHYLKADVSVTFWITLLLLTSLYIFETGRLRWYILSGLISGLSIGSQYNGICFIHVIFFAHLLRELKTSPVKNPIKKAIFSKKILLAYVASLASYLASNPYILFSLKQLLVVVLDILGIRNVSGTVAYGSISTVYRADFIIDTFKAFSLGLTPFFALAGLIGIVFACFSGNKKNLLVLVWFLPYLALIIALGALHMRFQILIYPGIFLLVAGFMREVFTRTRKTHLKIANVIGVAFFSLYAIVHSFAYDQAMSSKPTQQAASEWMISNIPPKTKIAAAANTEIISNPEIVHQDFYYKEDPRYKILALGYSIEALNKEKPVYVVLSKREWFLDSPFLGDEDYRADFIRYMTAHYSIIKKFENYPVFFNISFKPRIYIPDWEIPFPEIYIFKKKN